MLLSDPSMQFLASGLLRKGLLVLPSSSQIATIFAAGTRNKRHFSYFGDSLSNSIFDMGGFDPVWMAANAPQYTYNPGPVNGPRWQDTINYFLGTSPSDSSFARGPLSVHNGWQSGDVLGLGPSNFVNQFNPELTAWNPGFALIRFGTNDASGAGMPNCITNLTTMGNACTASGTVPCFFSIPDRGVLGTYTAAINTFNTNLKNLCLTNGWAFGDINAVIGYMANHGRGVTGYPLTSNGSPQVVIGVTGGDTVAATYTITITGAGGYGVGTFNWSNNVGGSGTGLLVNASVALGATNVSLQFPNVSYNLTQNWTFLSSDNVHPQPYYEPQFLQQQPYWFTQPALAKSSPSGAGANGENYVQIELLRGLKAAGGLVTPLISMPQPEIELPTPRLYRPESLVVLPPSSGAINPLSIGGLQMYHRADLGVTGTNPVTAWADQSGNGHTATNTGSPTWSSNFFGGFPAITFPAGQVLNHGLAYAGTAWTWIGVIKTISAAAYKTALSAGNVYIGGTLAGGTVWGVDSLTGTVDAASSHNITGSTVFVAASVSSASNITLYTSAFSSELITTGTGYNGGNGTLYGNDIFSDSFSGGSILISCLYNSALSASQIAGVKLFFQGLITGLA